MTSQTNESTNDSDETIVDSTNQLRVGVDFSAGQVDPLTGAKANVYTESWELRREQRFWFFFFALGFITLLTIGFIGFASALTWAIVTKDQFKFDWHYLFIGSTLILPPTVLLFMLATRIYRDDHHQHENKPEDQSSTPTGQSLTTLGELIKSLGDLLAKAGKNE